MSLSDKQLEAISSFKSGENVVIFGSAGSGKSYVIKEIYKLAKDMKKNIVLTATTGIAAYSISGSTIHSFMGFGRGVGVIDKIIDKIKGNKDAKERIVSTDVLVIDEISMMSAKFLERLNIIFKTIRKSNKDFGGIQIILSGDLLQLSPIFEIGSDKRMINESSLFNKLKLIKLDKIYRQSDQTFIDLLARVRIGEHTESDIDILNSRLTETKIDDDIDIIHLVPTNKQMININSSKLDLLNTEECKFKASYLGDKELIKELKNQFDQRGLSELTLKVGAKVMLVKNLNVAEGLVNGSLGKIIEFRNRLPLVQFSNKNIKLINIEDFPLSLGKKCACAKQIPLVLAWSTTIHRCQSQTLDKAVMSLGNCFTEHQIYVALSRVRTLDGIFLNSFDSKKIYINKNVKKYLQNN
jgi:ATP-dependent DNA helicase PIF1